MDTVTLLRDQLKWAHELLEGTVGDITPDQLHFSPPGRALPIGAAYAHVIFSEDILVAALTGSQPLYQQLGDATGASEHMPDFMLGEWGNYVDWTHRVRFDLPTLRQYAQQVYAADDAYLASLDEAKLAGPCGFPGSEDKSLAWFIIRGIIAHVDNLTGEISAVKGIQGLQGYPE